MFVADVLLRTSATFCQKTLVKLLHPLPSFLCGHEYQHGNAYYAYSKKNHCCSHFSLFAICIIIILTVIRRIAPAIPTTYIILPASDSSSNADVMITAVRTYFDMSIIKSEIFSQTEIFFTESLCITKIIKLFMSAKIWNQFGIIVVLT